MNKLIKICLFAVAFMFIAGCASKPQPEPQAPVAKEKVSHPSKHCKGKHCADKLGNY